MKNLNTRRSEEEKKLRKQRIKDGWDFELPMRYLHRHVKDGRVSIRVVIEALEKMQDTIYVIKKNVRNP